MRFLFSGTKGEAVDDDLVRALCRRRFLDVIEFANVLVDQQAMEARLAQIRRGLLPSTPTTPAGETSSTTGVPSARAPSFCRTVAALSRSTTRSTAAAVEHGDLGK